MNRLNRIRKFSYTDLLKIKRRNKKFCQGKARSKPKRYKTKKGVFGIAAMHRISFSYRKTIDFIQDENPLDLDTNLEIF